MNFSQFFRKGNTEDTLLIEYSLHCLHVTNFLSLDVCEDSFVDCVFLYYAEETEFEKSCLPLLPFAKLVPYLCWLFSKQGFIQAVLLMSVFERRLSHRILYFVKNDHKIILQ